jgi:hypothetical protein
VIYFAQLTTGAIKIGCSIDGETRIQKLECHYKQPVALLSTMAGDRGTEREIHQRFAHLGFGRSEQFRPGADLMGFISKPLLVSANPETVESIPGMSGTPLCLNVLISDYERLERCARARGLTKASYARQAVLSQVRRDEAEGGGK